MLSVWICLAMVVIGAPLFALGIGKHSAGAFFVGLLLLAAAALYGAMGSVPRDQAHDHH